MFGGSLSRALKSMESQGSSQPREWCQGDPCAPKTSLHRRPSLQCPLEACFGVLKAKIPQSCLTLCDPMDYIQSMKFSRPEYWSE